MRRWMAIVLWLLCSYGYALPCSTVGIEKIARLLNANDYNKVLLRNHAMVMVYRSNDSKGDLYISEHDLSANDNELWDEANPLIWAVLQVEFPEREEGICMVVQKQDGNSAPFVLHTWRIRAEGVSEQEQPITDFDAEHLHAGNVRALMLRWAIQKAGDA